MRISSATRTPDYYRDYHILDSVSRPPHPTTAYHSSIAVERPARAFEVVHVLLDLDPGIWTPQHIHGGQELVMVTAGQVKLQRQDDVQVFAPGESWVNSSGVLHAAGNDGRSFAQVGPRFCCQQGGRSRPSCNQCCERPQPAPGHPLPTTRRITGCSAGAGL
jgi:quercetin dioxygenase-like cupin family protein